MHRASQHAWQWKEWLARKRTGIATSESAAAAPAAAAFESKVFETGAEKERAAVARDSMVSE